MVETAGGHGGNEVQTIGRISVGRNLLEAGIANVLSNSPISPFGASRENFGTQLGLHPNDQNSRDPYNVDVQSPERDAFTNPFPNKS